MGHPRSPMKWTLSDWTFLWSDRKRMKIIHSVRNSFPICLRLSAHGVVYSSYAGTQNVNWSGLTWKWARKLTFDVLLQQRIFSWVVVRKLIHGHSMLRNLPPKTRDLTALPTLCLLGLRYDAKLHTSTEIYYYSVFGRLAPGDRLGCREACLQMDWRVAAADFIVQTYFHVLLPATDQVLWLRNC